MKCLAVFAAFFDPQMGNMLEWSATGDNACLLDEIEMLVLGPGFQYSSDEHVVFRLPGQSHIYGVASFNLLKTESQVERFSRMRSVGVLGTDVEEIRRLVPLLNYISRQLNYTPHEYSLLDTVSAVLMAPDCSDESILGLLERHINVLEDQSAVQLPEKIHRVPLVLSDPAFLILWRSVLCRRRVLLYSKTNAGKLCDLCLDLCTCSGLHGTDTSMGRFATRDFHNLMYRTISFEKEVSRLSGEGHSWLIATTDASLVTLPPIDWEVLVVLEKPHGDKEDTDKYLVERSNVMHTISISTRVDEVAATITLYFCNKNDRRLFSNYKRRKDEQLWRHIHSMPGTVSVQHSDVTADKLKSGLISWHRNMCCELVNAMLVEEEENGQQMSPSSGQHRILYSALSDICKHYGVHKTYFQWTAFFCEVFGVDVCNDYGCISVLPPSFSIRRGRPHEPSGGVSKKTSLKNNIVIPVAI